MAFYTCVPPLLRGGERQRRPLSFVWPRRSSIVFILLFACLTVELQARHYVLIRRVYAGEEGRAMLQKDESSRLLGWPLGVSSEIARFDSAPIFRAAVDKGGPDSSKNEVLPANGHEVVLGPPLLDGRAAPRRIDDVSAETQRKEDVNTGQDKLQTKVQPKSSANEHQEYVKQPKRIDIHNHEPDTAETHGNNSTRGQNATSSESNPLAAFENSESSDEDDEDLEPINIEDIEKIMARHKIRIMGAAHPMANIELDQEQAESVTEEERHGARSGDGNANTTTTQSVRAPKGGKIPEQIMRIAEWLLNQAP